MNSVRGALCFMRTVSRIRVVIAIHGHCTSSLHRSIQKRGRQNEVKTDQGGL